MLRKKLHSIVVELPMLKDHLRRVGGVEALLYFQAEEKFHQFISTTFKSWMQIFEQCFTLCIHLMNIDQECVTRD